MNEIDVFTLRTSQYSIALWLSRSGHLGVTTQLQPSAYIQLLFPPYIDNEQLKFPRCGSRIYTKRCLRLYAYNEQKAIALVQKAIDEDVKQNYAVRSNITSHVLTTHFPIGSIQAVPGCPRLFYDGKSVIFCHIRY